MFGKYLGSVFVVCLLADILQTSSMNLTSPQRPRNGKVLSLFQIIQFQNGFCMGFGNRNGTCYTQGECEARDGSSVGTCANGFGVCCAFTLSCGQSTSENCTYLVQSSTSTIANPCTYTVCPANNNICRIRFDFTTFNINGPVTGSATATIPALTTAGGAIGDCATDIFTITAPGNFAPPVICGFNTGQHMIVDASRTMCNEAQFSLNGMGTREWDIKVTQYNCGDEQGGPDGCLQYFTGLTGTVSSFNFPTTSAIVDPTTTHLSSQMQTMCWRQEMNTCAICWIPVVLGSDTITGSFGLSVSKNKLPRGETDGLCSGDYLQIPNAQSNVETNADDTFVIGTIGSDVNLSDRICGRFFSSALDDAERQLSRSVCTQQRPFRMTFQSDGDEVTLTKVVTKNPANLNELNRIPGGIVGFNLRWTLQTCS
ncbi:uncharacterized protein LOC131876989 isoform X1 [Tigriopus californicus]|uniref:uncharacterized protein LOC131876989 isoform X1 n=1 Tax=Tigriopus californicus TaxID=6832 RepID=UPI0027DA1989|nr:uncharacterized protein LOC131876989 isoform X1 [Tigriopus californicus]